MNGFKKEAHPSKDQMHYSWDDISTLHLKGTSFTKGENRGRAEVLAYSIMLFGGPLSAARVCITARRARREDGPCVGYLFGQYVVLRSRGTYRLSS